MLMAHPTVLRNLVERYEALRTRVDERPTSGPDSGNGVDSQLRQQLQDTVYTLCVSTGTREIGPALAAAREHIARFAFGEAGTPAGTAA
ncbi:DUF5133 domain-containing protein [Actinacidiphila acididurans]|uniref:DUF5133 domain-containing protein n=1 Tax=Actinacidiphila acididurans TaxID=2784346 RepID=A0ABS2U1U9_9ACTN|nr:DUF5133 domain-containing protein [Actinacidiphila acididurans]MBM9508163.1 DUF5133 domain-containing protein [Actinacidiphila acididurans]